MSATQLTKARRRPKARFALAEADRQRIAMNLCLIPYVLILFLWFIGSTTLQLILPPGAGGVVRYLAVVCLFVKQLAAPSERPGQNAAMAALLAVMLTAAILSGYGELVEIALVTVGLRGVPARRIVRLFFGTIATLLTITVLLSLTGVTINLRYTRGSVVGNSFGICYPTDFAAYVFFLELSWFYLREGRLRYAEILAMAAIGAAVWALCGTRMTCGCIALLCAVALFEKFCGNHPKRRLLRGARRCLGRLAIIAMPACFVLLLILLLTYSENVGWMYRLNAVMSQRLSLQGEGLRKYGMKLFGQYIEMRGSGGSTASFVHWGDYFFLDSALISIPMRFGVVPFLAMMAGFVHLAARSVRSGRYHLAYVVALLSVNALIEQHLPELNYNPFLVLFFAELGSGKREAGVLPARIGKAFLKGWSRRRRQLLTMGILIAYVLMTAILLFGSGNDVERWYRSNGITDVRQGERITQEFEYRQYFYTTATIDGLQMRLDTTPIKPRHALYVRIGDAESGDVIATETLPAGHIWSGVYFDLLFSGYVLEEGHQYYFELAEAPPADDTDTGAYIARCGRTESAFVSKYRYRGKASEDSDYCLDFNLTLTSNGRLLALWMLLTTALILAAAYVARQTAGSVRRVAGVLAVMLCVAGGAIWIYANFAAI